MKKVLFATTALVAFAGAASAEIAMSGDAEMGVVGGDVAGDTQFWQTFDVTFTGSGETDFDLTFGATVDLTEAGGNEDSTDDNGYAVWVKGSFGNLTLGNTDGAMDWALAEANSTSPGSIADDESAHAGYFGGSYLDGSRDYVYAVDPIAGSGGEGQILRYDNTFGNISAAVSVEQGDNGATDAGMAVGVKADFNGIGIGVGYQKAAGSDGAGATTPSAIGLSVSGDFGGGISAVAMYTQYSDFGYDAGQDATNMQIGIGVSNGPTSFHANYGSWDIDGVASGSGFGVAAAYDFGGGLSANVGYGDGEGTSTWSAGFVMSF